MADTIRSADLSKGWLPVAAVCAIIATAVSLAWGAAVISTKVDQLAVQNDKLAAQVERLATKSEIDSLQREHDRMEQRLEIMNTWIASTRIKLAEQGYKTPQFPVEPKN